MHCYNNSISDFTDLLNKIFTGIFSYFFDNTIYIYGLGIKECRNMWLKK